MQDRFHKLYTYNDGLLISNLTGQPLSNEDRDGYIRVRVGGKEYRAHRVIWEMFNGPIPEGMLVDHIDRNVYNNRIENLRLVTRQQNNANRGNIPGKYNLPKGVTKNGKRFRAKIYYKGEAVCLGTYDTPEEASMAYTEAAEILNGEFAAKI